MESNLLYFFVLFIFFIVFPRYFTSIDGISKTPIPNYSFVNISLSNSLLNDIYLLSMYNKHGRLCLLPHELH